MDVFRDIQRYWQTIRYLRPTQVASRIDLRTRAAARAISPNRTRQTYARRAAQSGLLLDHAPWAARDSASTARALTSPSHLPTIDRSAYEIERGVFTFLNERRELGQPIDWTAQAAPQLWRYHLHYFDYLPDLLVAGQPHLLPPLMTDWIARVPIAERNARDAWHPYVVSVRLVNWMLAIATTPQAVQWPDAIAASLQIQTLFLADNLETDVGGNHLLKNLKALAMAGCFWEGALARELRDRFVAAFIGQLTAQLRSDGGHYEQSPMYHAQVFGDAIELAMVLQLKGEQSPSLLKLLRRMEDFLIRVCHPDGQLVQFGDTAAGMVSDPSELLAAAAILEGCSPGPQLVPRHALLGSRMAEGAPVAGSDCFEPRSAERPLILPDTWDPGASGFVTLETGDSRGFLIADAGPVCPDDLPAHAHSDLFGFEVSIDGTRIVVDSGVSEYAAGAWRDYYRSTRAHSTVMVDGAEQSECWGSFRVARRARVVDARYESSRPHLKGFSAAHTGFDALPLPVRHRRRFLLVAGRFWILIDELSGQGHHTWSTFLHLHPEVVLRSHPSGLVASRSSSSLGIVWFGIDAPRCVRGEREPLQGWHAPAFGEVHAAPTLIGSASGNLDTRFGWILVPGLSGDDVVSVDDAPDGTLAIHIGRETHEIPLTA